VNSSDKTHRVVLPDKADDVKLVERIASGDADALGELYDRYGRVAFGVVYRMLPGPEAAEEVAQDAFHAVWRQARSYRPHRGSVRTWLLAICRNAAIDWRRTRGKRLEREVTIEAAADLLSDARVDERVVSAARAERVRKVVGELPKEQREVLALAFWGGYSQTEIAARTGTPLGTVKSRVRLAMNKLRESLEDER
jgi:RNA polymerase sigma-70 factor (ECF subfamily)